MLETNFLIFRSTERIQNQPKETFSSHCNQSGMKKQTYDLVSHGANIFLREGIEKVDAKETK